MRVLGLLSCFCSVVLFLMTAAPVQAQDPLSAWARRDVAGMSNNLNAVAFGNGVFVAVGNNSTVATSVDGTSWTVSTAGAYGDLARVRFLNGEFVAVGSSDKILWSADGAAWAAGTLPSAGSWDVAYGNGTYVVAGSTIFVSTNGVTWSVVTLPPIEVFPSVRITLLDSIVFGGNRFIGLTSKDWDDPRPRPGVYSTNGVDWVEAGNAPSTKTGGTGDALFADGLFMGTGDDVYRTGLPGVWISGDGIDWCCGFVGGPTISNGGDESTGVALAHGHGHYLWVQQGGPSTRHGVPYIYSSLNGTSWVERVAAPRDIPPSYWDPKLVPLYDTVRGNVRGAAFGSGAFVLVGEGGYILQSGNFNGTPLITQQPQDRGAVTGNPVSFSVTAAGSLPLAYQWFHDGTAIPGATSPSYAIGQVVAGDMGGYNVVITNSFGSVTSRVAQLSISFLDIKSYAGIEILGLVGRTYRVEATPASGPVNWQTLTNLVLPTSPYIWIDFGSPAAGQRIYRAAELP
jgi:hypothetical protein